MLSVRKKHRIQNVHHAVAGAGGPLKFIASCIKLAAHTADMDVAHVVQDAIHVVKEGYQGVKAVGKFIGKGLEGKNETLVNAPGKGLVVRGVKRPRDHLHIAHTDAHAGKKHKTISGQGYHVGFHTADDEKSHGHEVTKYIHRVSPTTTYTYKNPTTAKHFEAIDKDPKSWATFYKQVGSQTTALDSGPQHGYDLDGHHLFNSYAGKVHYQIVKMARGRRYGRRRRYYRRRRRRSSGYSLAKYNAKRIQRIQPELNFHDIDKYGTALTWLASGTAMAHTAAASGRLICLNSLDQGTGASNRIGNDIFCTRITLKGLLYGHSTRTEDNIVRLLVVLDRTPQGTDITNGDFLQQVGAPGESTSMYAVANSRGFKILWDHVFILPQTGTNCVEFVKQIPLGFKTHYNATGGGSTDIYSGAVWLYAVSESTTNTPGMSFKSRLRYRDA